MKRPIGLVTAGLFILAIGFAAPSLADERELNLRFDVAQNGNTFKAVAFDGEAVFDTITDMGNPSQGGLFSVLGYIYPKGTLQGGSVSGTNEDGSPAFPEKVLGTWSCRGWFVKDGDPGVTGIQLLGSQVWVFNTKGPFGRKTITTDGVDLSVEDEDLNVKMIRAITGGTGPYKGARGQQVMVNYGFNDSFGFDSTHSLRFRVPKD